MSDNDNDFGNGFIFGCLFVPLAVVLFIGFVTVVTHFMPFVFGLVTH